MTTVAYRNGVIASESRVTQDDMIVPSHQPKIFRLPDGTLFGWCGTLCIALQMLQYMLDDDAKECPTWRDNTEVIHIDEKGRVRTYEGIAGVWIPARAPYVAIGSGSPYAYGAMAAGADAIAAVKIAKKFDTSSGGPVRSLRLKEEKKCKTKKSA